MKRIAKLGVLEDIITGREKGRYSMEERGSGRVYRCSEDEKKTGNGTRDMC